MATVSGPQMSAISCTADPSPWRRRPGRSHYGHPLGLEFFGQARLELPREPVVDFGAFGDRRRQWPCDRRRSSPPRLCVHHDEQRHDELPDMFRYFWTSKNLLLLIVGRGSPARRLRRSASSGRPHPATFGVGVAPARAPLQEHRRPGRAASVLCIFGLEQRLLRVVK